MSVIYIIESGEYSDRTNHCAFVREEDAVAYLAAMGLERESEYTWRKREPYAQPWSIDPLELWSAGEVPHIDA